MNSTKHCNTIHGRLLGAVALGVFLLVAGCGGNGDGDKEPACDPGAADCECKDGDTCNEGLECKDGKCVKPTEPGCTKGAKDCECKDDGTCDTGLECKDGKCATATEPGCTKGAKDCECKDDGTCDTGLECKDGKCAVAAATGAGLTVGNAAVRSCDVVFVSEGAVVKYAAGVRGVTAVKGARIALSFTATKDEAFTEPVASIAGPGGEALSGLAPEKLECYDRLGAVVSEPGLQLK